MDIRVVLKLCSFVCLIVSSFATESKSAINSNNNGKDMKNVEQVLKDLQTAAGEHYGGDNHEDSGYMAKGMKGGSDKGGKKYDGSEWDKKGSDYGKSGKKKYEQGDNWGSNKWNKNNMDSYGDKWGQKAGKENKGKFEEWADNQKWKTDKGKGYEKSYEYDKSDGSKNSFGKNGKNDMSKYEDSHGSKQGLNKKDMSGKDNFGKKNNQGKSGFDEWGNMYKKGGKHNKGMDWYSSKKPSTQKSSKWKKQEMKKAPAPPPKHYEAGDEMAGYDDQGEQGHDMGGDVEGGYDGADLGAYDLSYDQGWGTAQKVTFADLKNQGYIVIDETAGQGGDHPLH